MRRYELKSDLRRQNITAYHWLRQTISKLKNMETGTKLFVGAKRAEVFATVQIRANRGIRQRRQQPCF